MNNSIKTNKYFRNILKDKLLIICIIAITVVWAMIYISTRYKPAYESSARVLIKDITKQPFVINNPDAAENNLKPLTSAGNPILTQLEIVQSRQIQDMLAKYLQTSHPEVFKKITQGGANPKIEVEAKNKTGTDIIDIALKWEDPQIAKELLGVALKEYEQINLNINRKINTQRRKYIDKKVVEVGNKLIDVRNQIKEYKLGTLAISLQDESTELVKQKIAFSSQLENTQALIRDTQGKVRELESKLSMSTKDALNAVALGSYNENLTKLREELNAANQLYANDSVKFADTNPKMVALKAKINQIKRQINSQIELSIGKSARKNGINILDPVREKLVEDLATSQATLKGLRAQKSSLLQSMRRINSVQSHIPAKKYTLDNLEQMERNLSAAYDQLKINQLEARIKEAETVSNISVIDTPDLPVNTTFPAASHILFASVMLGNMLGVFASMIKTNVQNICEDTDSIEELTRKPIIGIIPWFKNINSEKTAEVYNFSLKTLVSSFVLRAEEAGVKVVSLASTSTDKSRNATTYDLACNLRRLGYRVAVVDADLTIPGMLRNADILGEVAKTNLSDLIRKIEKKQKYKEPINEQDILSYAVQDKKGVKIFGNLDSVSSTYENLGIESFRTIINILRENFDWVLIDTPSATVTPEFPLIAKIADCAAILASYRVKKYTLVRLISLLKENHIPLLGTIIREKDSVIEKDYAESVSRVSIINSLIGKEEPDAEAE